MSVVESAWSTPEPALTESETSGLTARELHVLHEELARILTSHHFINSKRCQAFLRYTVREILSGRRDLKERSIGVEVFERSPSYDTNQDPVVRMTAGEVRKRLALYYQDASHASDLRIELPVGTYAPRLLWSPSIPVEPALSPLPARSSNPTPETVAEAIPANSSATHHLGRFAPSRRAMLALAAVILVTVCACLARWRVHLHSAAPAAIQQFWTPVLASPNPVLFSIGQIRPTMAEVEPNITRSSVKRAIALQGSLGYPHEIAVAVLNDAVAMAEMSSLLNSEGRQTILRSESATSLNDLERGPFVLIGAFNNDWSILFSDPLRFHFNLDERDGSQYIADREHPERRIGLIPAGSTVASLKSDYAIVARFYDQRTRETVVIAAGLTPYGTRAAGDFLTDPAALAELERRAPAGWAGKNMEVLIRTDLIDNEAGPPIIIDKTFW